MTLEQLKNNLIVLYGENAFNLMLEEIEKLRLSSNIPFDVKYVGLSLSFVMENSEQIIQEKKKKCSLYALVHESFGEAAIYKYNCCNGKL